MNPSLTSRDRKAAFFSIVETYWDRFLTGAARRDKFFQGPPLRVAHIKLTRWFSLPRFTPGNRARPQIQQEEGEEEDQPFENEDFFDDDEEGFDDEGEQWFDEEEHDDQYADDQE